MRSGGGDNRTSGAYGSGAYTGSTGGSAEFQQVRAAINSGNYAYAEQLLNGASNRNAEWNFLMGSLYYRKGWMDEAKTYYQRAVNMAPGNAEYRQALNFMDMGGQAYRPAGYQNGGIDACDICTGLMCANMCCRCM